MKRNKKGQFVKGIIPWNKGVKAKDDERVARSIEVASRAHIGKPPWNKGRKCLQLSGENHPNWKGGKPKCKKCNKELVSVYATLCQKCYAKDPKRKEGFREIMGGKTVWNKGKIGVYSNETLKRMSEAKRGKSNLKIRGKNHYNWRGGNFKNRQIAYGRYKYRTWRRNVYERDNYTCQLCGDNSGGNLIAHHILPFRDFKQFRYTSKNGVTLCKECHLPTIGKEFLYIPEFLSMI